VSWQGGADYLHGVNLPWLIWRCDFGCGEDDGVSAGHTNEDIAEAFADLQQRDIHVVRWWVFPGDPWQISRDGAEMPIGLEPGVFQDFDAAMALAETYDIYYVFTLFSAPNELPSTFLETAEGRAGVANALAPLFARYSGNPRVLSWQVINEPEWDIWDERVNQSDVQDLVRRVAASVHANSNALVSVGSAMLDGLPMWQGLGLDYYTAHWYDYMEAGNWCVTCTTYAEVQSRYNLDGPLVIGEFYAGPDVSGRFEDFYNRGFAGAWAWSLFPYQTLDGLQIDLDEAAEFADSHADVGP
jgi:hypothetical protein